MIFVLLVLGPFAPQNSLASTPRATRHANLFDVLLHLFRFLAKAGFREHTEEEGLLLPNLLARTQGLLGCREEG